MGSKVASGARGSEQGFDLVPFPLARAHYSAEDEFESVVFCYTSVEPAVARAAIDAMSATLHLHWRREFFISAPAFLASIHEDIVSEYTADKKSTVFQIFITKHSGSFEGDICDLARILRCKFPEVLVLWENQLRL